MFLDEIITAQKRGETRGIMSLCSAHPWVIKAAMYAHKGPLLIEATCHQVNQYGGYTGMTPGDFVAYVNGIAQESGFPVTQLILGGDHLGPNVWKKEPAAIAMEKSKVLIKACVQAGYTKIHLDTSMQLGDDPEGTPDLELIARRAATLAKCAEESAPDVMRLRYVIGTEVPPPGGALDHEEDLHVSTVESTHQTLEFTRKAFLDENLGSAWERVSAVVVNPGVEFGDGFVKPYDPARAAALSKFIEDQPLIYEAHSTDYQALDALRNMVRDHFAILKVGPALTNAFREAVFRLAAIEQELIPAAEQSNIIDQLETVMLEHPEHWRAYYHGSPAQLAQKRMASLSDRIRYYWPDPRAQEALKYMLANLSKVDITSKLMKVNEAKVAGSIKLSGNPITPRQVILAHIRAVLDGYDRAVKG
jgi:D-tagatose-1,6-bisphosphate aldolase subunit GatZ/KbaZ